MAQAIFLNLLFRPHETVGALYGHSSGGTASVPTSRPQPRGRAVVPAGNCYSPFSDRVEGGRPHHPLKPCSITVREAQVGHALPVPRSGVSTRKSNKR